MNNDFDNFGLPFLLSSTGHESLVGLASSWHAYLVSNPGVALGDVVATAALGRAQLPVRFGVCIREIRELRESLAELIRGGVLSSGTQFDDVLGFGQIDLIVPSLSFAVRGGSVELAGLVHDDEVQVYTGSTYSDSLLFGARPRRRVWFFGGKPEFEDFALTHSSCNPEWIEVFPSGSAVDIALELFRRGLTIRWGPLVASAGKRLGGLPTQPALQVQNSSSGRFGEASVDDRASTSSSGQPLVLFDRLKWHVSDGGSRERTWSPSSEPVLLVSGEQNVDLTAFCNELRAGEVSFEKVELGGDTSLSSSVSKTRERLSKSLYSSVLVVLDSTVGAQKQLTMPEWMDALESIFRSCVQVPEMRVWVFSSCAQFVPGYQSGCDVQASILRAACSSLASRLLPSRVVFVDLEENLDQKEAIRIAAGEVMFGAGSDYEVAFRRGKRLAKFVSHEADSLPREPSLDARGVYLVFGSSHWGLAYATSLLLSAGAREIVVLASSVQEFDALVEFFDSDSRVSTRVLDVSSSSEVESLFRSYEHRVRGVVSAYYQSRVNNDSTTPGSDRNAALNFIESMRFLFENSLFLDSSSVWFKVFSFVPFDSGSSDSVVDAAADGALRALTWNSICTGRIFSMVTCYFDGAESAILQGSHGAHLGQEHTLWEGMHQEREFLVRSLGRGHGHAMMGKERVFEFSAEESLGVWDLGVYLGLNETERGQHLLRFVLDSLARSSSIPESSLRSDTKVSDLGLDSLVSMNFVRELEDSLEISLPNLLLEEFDCISDFVEALAGELD